MLCRNPHWAVDLTAFLARVALEPLAYGRHDCALFAAGAVLAMTGQDPAAAFRGRYTTRRGGIRVLRRAGFADHIAAARACLPGKPLACAVPGDLAIVQGEDGLALGVVQGACIYVLRAQGGLGLLPVEAAVEVLAV